MRWFRYYDDALNDPKVQRLSGDLFKAWVNLLCLASQGDGKIKSLADAAFALRLSEAKAGAVVAELARNGLMDDVAGGYFEPHNWSGRQYISDGSAERVKRHRAKRAAAGLIPQWTASKELRAEVYTRDNFQCVYCGSEENLSLDHRTPEIRGGTHDASNLQTACMSCNGAKRDLTHEEYVTRNADVTLLKRPQSTEADNRTEQKDIRAVGKPTRSERDEKFEEFKQAYPKRKGANPWKPAQALFDRAVLAGSSADQIIAAAKSGVGYDREKVGTEYIPQAVKWLRDERWKDLLATPAVSDRPAYMTPPPGCRSYEEEMAIYRGDDSNGQGGAEIRSDGRMGKERPH